MCEGIVPKVNAIALAVPPPSLVPRPLPRYTATMTNTIKGRSLLTWLDWTAGEIRRLLEISGGLKTGGGGRRFDGMTLALLFEKRSTRTRCAFETAFGEEGGHPVFLAADDIQLGAKETVEDTARVLGRMFSAIQFRGFSHETAEKLAEHSGVPVYNGLTDSFHPTQALADIMTLEENFGECRSRSLCYVGDGRNNVANSLLVICAKLGVNFTVVAPPELSPDAKLLQKCREFASVSGAAITVTPDTAALAGADAVYTDVWTSMGEESRKAEREKLLSPYRVNEKLMSMTGRADSIFLHCLPAVRGEEVTAEVLDGRQSRVWDQAENRKHTIKAVMLATLTDLQL